MSTILIISPESWEDHFVSKHHYSITLASKGHKVYFLNPPNLSINNISVNLTEYDKLFKVDSPIIVKGLRFYPRFLRKWIEARWLKKLEKQIGCSFDVIWLFENSRFYNMEFASKRLKIYHQVDLNQNFHVSEAASSADICFCTTEYILNAIKPWNQKVYKIHHGVEIPEVTRALPDNYIQYFKNTDINATYIGNLAMRYLDVEALFQIIKLHPEVQFQFVGGYNSETPLYVKCSGLDNINWWGKVDSNYIIEILKKSDVVLVSYMIEHYLDQASPHKVMEYLASGKVIVATYTDEYKDKPGLLEMSKGKEEFIATFKKVVNNLKTYNSEENQKMRKIFAYENTYEKKVDEIFKYLSQNKLNRIPHE